MENKEILKSKIILNIIVLGIIIAGIVIIATKGMDVALDFSEKNKIQIPLEQEFSNDEIYSIVKEVMGNNKNIHVTKVEVFSDIIGIEADVISNEEKNQIISKINEKYKKQINKDDIEIVYIANTRLLDVVKPYIMPISVSFAIILGYMAIRFRKLNSIFVVLKMGLTTIILQLLLI